MHEEYGLLSSDMKQLTESFKKYQQIEKVILFGSRALGNYKKGSDIDLAIFGTKADFETTNRLSGLLNEKLPIPYFIDVLNFNSIENTELKQHILNEGKIIYQK